MARPGEHSQQESAIEVSVVSRVLCSILLAAVLVSCRTQPPVDCASLLSSFSRDAGFNPDGGAVACDRLNHLPTSVHYHVATCDDPTCGDGYNPPTGGPHCPYPLPCHDYSTAQARCSWIHNLEHGHVVFAHNCPGGCPDEVNALGCLLDELPLQSSGAPRALITPDPQLPNRVAAVVWGWSFSADDLDPDAIRCLITHQDQEAPEAGLACAQ